ncbi:Malate dehydrogenase [Geodia barretti]|nr:Malate dehydrogenase [Geodia barretti]
MSRDDLLLTNMKIVTSVVNEVVAQSPDTVLMPVTNPLDAMAQRAFQVSGFPKQRVVGMPDILDTARFRTFLAMERLDVSVESIDAWVLGGHGDSMVPVVGSTIVGGQPISKLIPKGRLDAIVKRTQDGGAEIVNYLKTGSAYYAPSLPPSSRWSRPSSSTRSRLSLAPPTSKASTDRRTLRRSPGQAGSERRGRDHRVRPHRRRIGRPLQRSADAVRELVEVMDNANG